MNPLKDSISTIALARSRRYRSISALYAKTKLSWVSRFTVKLSGEAAMNIIMFMFQYVRSIDNGSGGIRASLRQIVDCTFNQPLQFRQQVRGSAVLARLRNLSRGQSEARSGCR